jgi:hypothetical protein
MPGSYLKAAIQLTTGTIDRRAALFRNLVIGVVGLIFIPGLWALIQWSWVPLTGLFGIVPLCVVFFCMDIKKIAQWQDKILAAWRQGELDLDLFSQTLATLRTLPPGTLNAMLATLPTQTVSESGQPLSDTTKSIVSRTLKTINQCQFDRTAMIGMAASFGLAALVAALILWRWYPVVIIIGSVICFPVYRWLQWFRLNKLRDKIVDLENEPDQEVLPEILSKLNWGSICEKRKNRWLTRHKRWIVNPNGA